MPAHTQPKPGIIVLLLLIWALYVPHLNRVMFCDEANTLYQYASSLPRAALSYATPNNHILHSVLVWFTTQLAGTSAPVVRLTAVSAALLAAALIYRIGARAAGTYAGIAAALFMVTNLVFADFAINARGYTLSVLLTLALIHEVFTARRLRGYTILLISAGLLLVLPSMLLLNAGIGAWVLLTKRGRRRVQYLLPVIFGSLTGLLIYVPAFAFGLFSQHFAAFGETDLPGLIAAVGTQTFATPIIGVAFAACALIGLFQRPRLRGLMLTILGVALLISVAQLAVLGKLFWTRNYLFVIAPVALLAGVGFSQIMRWIERMGLRGKWIQPALVAASAAAALLLFPSTALDSNYAEKEVIGLVEQNVGAHDQIVAAPCFNAPIQHYLLHIPGDERLFSTPETERVFVFLNSYSLDEVTAMFGAQVHTCEPVSDGSWGSWGVMVCQPG
mgnify:CR=1 FL=1